MIKQAYNSGYKLIADEGKVLLPSADSTDLFYEVLVPSGSTLNNWIEIEAPKTVEKTEQDLLAERIKMLEDELNRLKQE